MAEDTAQPAAEPKAAPAPAPDAGAPAAADTPAKSDAPAGETPAERAARVYSQDEVDKILAKVKKNERYRTRKEVEAFYQGRESAAPKPAEPAKAAAADDKPPTRENFDSYEAFLDAKAEYTGKKAAHEYRQKAEAEQKERTAREAQAERIKSFQTKVNEKYPDLAERAESIAHVEMPPGMADAISESDFGPDILNHFVSDTKDFERIAALSPSAAIREIGRLEARLEGAAKPATPAPVAEVKKPSAAPAPVRPVGGTAVTGSDDLSKLVDNPAAWKAARERDIRAKRGINAK